MFTVAAVRKDGSIVCRHPPPGPPLIEKVINDRMPENMSVARLRKGMSNNWDDQLQEFRIEA